MEVYKNRDGMKEKKKIIWIFFKKKGRWDFEVEKVNDIWIVLKVCAGTIIENCACNFVLLRWIEIVCESLQTFMESSGKSFRNKVKLFKVVLLTKNLCCVSFLFV